MTIRNAIRLAAVLLGIGALGYSQWSRHAPASDAAHGVAIPPHAAGFDLGQLHFRACELPQAHSAATTSAYCAPFQVPENWDASPADQASGRRIDLRLALVASDGEVADRDLVVLLAGGPGQSAVDSWPQIAGAFAPLRKHRHVLLLDQRGTGGSNALNCHRDGADSDDGFDLEKLKAQTVACLADVGTHADPRYYTTGMALRDLEAVRLALGAPPLDLVGISYGTRVALQFMRSYPDAVRSVVLDSAVPNEHAIGSAFAANLDDALKAGFAPCVATPACAKAYGDPWANLLQLRERLRRKPVEVAYRDPVDHAAKTMRLDEYSLATLARMYAYAPETAALLPLAVAQALAGEAGPLVAQVQLISGELEGFSDNAMQLSVICSEDADLIQPRADDAQTLLGTTLVQAFKAQCAIWPQGTRAANFHDPVASDTPVLILGGEFDPVTPPRYAEQIAKTLTNARVLIAKGQAHGVMGRGCLPKLVEGFVEKLDPKTLDAACVADLGPTPAFIGYNGAGP